MVFSQFGLLPLCVAALVAGSPTAGAQEPPPSFSFKANREPNCAIAAPDDERASAIGDALWAARQQAEPFCLFVGARLWINRDLGRATDLLALGKVRAAYDAARCASDPQAEELLWLVRSTAEAELRAAGANEAPFLKRIARDPNTYRYPVEHLDRGCASVLPKRGWPEARRQVEARVLRPDH